MNSVVSHSGRFLNVICGFLQITLQMIVLATAVFFIFFGVPLVFCVSSVPICVILIARE